MTRYFRFFILLISACLPLAGCGGGDDSSATVNASAPAPLPHLAPNSTQLASSLVNGSDTWPAGSSASGGRGQPTDGVQCADREDYHIHAHLSIIRDGKLLALPADIGLQGCTYEMHTHDRSGIIHVEAPAARQFTLGQFFSVWGQALDRGQVAGLRDAPLSVFLNDGQGLVRYSGDPRAIEIRAHRMIYLVLGAPPAQLPAYHWSPTL